MTNESITCEKCGKECKGKVGHISHMAKHARESEVKEAPKVVAATSAIDTEAKLVNLESKLDKLVEVVGSVVDRMTTTPATTVAMKIGLDEVEETGEDLSKFVPKAWRALVDKKLGKDIGLEVEDSADGNFIVYFYMPEHLDRRVGDRNGRDHSTGLVRRSSAIADMEKWCELILANIKKTYNSYNV